MSAEYERQTANGWAMLGFLIVAPLALAASLVLAITTAAATPRGPDSFTIAWMILSLLGISLVAILWSGFFALQPNEGAVLLLFGAYKGTVRQEGIQWASPFYKKMKISLRARNLNGDKLKVNDQRGNPIEIAAVVVWRVRDTAHPVVNAGTLYT